MVSLVLLVLLGADATAQSLPGPAPHVRAVDPALAAGAAPGLVDASPVVLPVPQASAEASRWYGWQIMLADLGMAAAVAAGGGTRTSWIVGAAGYSLAGPAVHAMHRDGRAAAGSALRRATFPLAAAALGAGAGAVVGCGASGSSCGATAGAYVGFAAGIGAAMVADWVLTRDAPLASSGRIGWAPFLFAVGDARGVGVAGQF